MGLYICPSLIIHVREIWDFLLRRSKEFYTEGDWSMLLSIARGRRIRNKLESFFHMVLEHHPLTGTCRLTLRYIGG